MRRLFADPEGQKPKPVKLKTTEFPDGTGTIGLPAGWRIDGSYRGTVGCKGPNNTAVLMGMAIVIAIPETDFANIPRDKPIAIAPHPDLAAAIRAVIGSNGGRVISLKGRPAPSALPGVPAMNFVYDYKDSKGLLVTAMGYFTSLEPVGAMWQLYSSAVFAPKERFVAELPTLTAIYSSWRPNGGKPKPGSDGAMIDAVIESNRKMQQDNLKARQESFDRMVQQWRSIQ